MDDITNNGKKKNLRRNFRELSDELRLVFDENIDVLILYMLCVKMFFFYLFLFLFSEVDVRRWGGDAQGDITNE